MAPLITTALLWLLVAATSVKAGNRAWESSIHLARVEQEELLKVGNVVSNGTKVVQKRHNGSQQLERQQNQATALGKRWFGITSGGITSLWDKGNIMVCFEQRNHQHKGSSKTTEQILRGDLETARELWRNVGLDDGDGWFKFDFTKNDNDPGWCRDRAHRHEFLLVMYAGEGVEEMGTTPGQAPRRDASNTNTAFAELGSRMLLSDSVNMGMLNVVPNYAHEMGHAWGLHHEHQNPRWWQAPRPGESREDYFFGEGSFFCENLKDYDAAVQKVRTEMSGKFLDFEIQRTIKELCTKREVATHFKFAGGLNFLPVVEPTVMFDNSKKEPDWESIMIYPSGAGAKGTGGDRLSVLLKKPNGDKIDPVSKPSKEDVEGLKKMYAAPKKKKTKLFSEIGSAFKSGVDKLRKKDPDAACI